MWACVERPSPLSHGGSQRTTESANLGTRTAAENEGAMQDRRSVRACRRQECRQSKSKIPRSTITKIQSSPHVTDGVWLGLLLEYHPNWELVLNTTVRAGCSTFRMRECHIKTYSRTCTGGVLHSNRVTQTTRTGSLDSCSTLRRARNRNLKLVTDANNFLERILSTIWTTRPNTLGCAGNCRRTRTPKELRITLRWKTSVGVKITKCTNCAKMRIQICT